MLVLPLPLVLLVALPLTIAVVTLPWGSEFRAAATKALSSGRGPFALGSVTFAAFCNSISNTIGLIV